MAVLNLFPARVPIGRTAKGELVLASPDLIRAFQGVVDRIGGAAGTVVDIAMTVPTGLSVAGSPVTGTGTFALSYTAGYSIPTDASQANWNTAYGWGNHATAGYLTTAAAAAGYVALTGNQSIAGIKTFTTQVVYNSTTEFLIGHTASVAGGSGATLVQIHTTGDSFSAFKYSNNTNATELSLNKSRGALGANTTVASGDSLGVVSFSGADGTNFKRGAWILAQAEGTVSAGVVPGRMILSTANAAGTITEALRVDSAQQVNLGGAATAGVNFGVTKNITGATTSRGASVAATVQSDVTTLAQGFRTSLATQATSFTLTALHHFSALQGTIGAGSTVTSQMGFSADSTLTGATNNYGFYGNIASTANRWNFYAAGTAANHFTGLTTFGAKFGYGTTAVGGTVTQLTNKTTGVTLDKPTGQITMEATTAINAGAVAAFTLTSSAIEAADTVIVHRKSGGTASAYRVWCDSVAAGSCVICVENRTAGNLTETPVLTFSVIRGATS